MTTGSKEGSLSPEELLTLWIGAVDPSYSEPLIKAGDGAGLEVFTQAFEQLARVSTAIDRSTQAMYTLSHSSQTDEPASGGIKATVALTFERSGFVGQPLILGAGCVSVQERRVDAGENGGVEILTGVRYVLSEELVFMPGERGPFTVQAHAEREGRGYNDPLPSIITRIDNAGTGLYHERAAVSTVLGPQPIPGQSVRPVPPYRTTIQAVNEADMFVPNNIGQYVLFTSGANESKVARVVDFTSPVAPNGSAVLVEPLACVVGTPQFGSFAIGQLVRCMDSGGTNEIGYGTIRAARTSDDGTRVAFTLLSGTVVVGGYIEDTITGSIVQLLVTSVYVDGLFTDEAPIAGVGGASWRVLDWAEDLGLTCTNVASPSGGRIGMLDMIGYEHGIQRAPVEGDPEYRNRIAKIADTVSPNAIRRAIVRALKTLPWCFREVGADNFPGFYLDCPSNVPEGFLDWGAQVVQPTLISGPGFLLDEPCYLHRADGSVLSCNFGGPYLTGTYQYLIFRSGVGRLASEPISGSDVLQGLQSGTHSTIVSQLYNSPSVPTKRFRCLLSYEQMRAFFLVGVPQLVNGDFGFSYDTGSQGALDDTTLFNFFDGFTVSDATTYRRLWAAIDKVRAGGVGFDLYVMNESCA